MKTRVIAMLVTILISAKFASSQSTFGSMVGLVKDPGALVVVGAQVTLRGVDDRSTHEATTNGDGTFEFMNLKPGKYEVAIQAIGFADSKTPIVELVARQTLRLEVALKVKSASETIEVSDTAPVINTESAALADSKDFVQVSQLSGNYRGATTSSLAMVATVPGTQQDANGNVSVGGGLPHELPVGSGRRFFNHMSSAPQAVLGGWSISTVTVWQTGPYLTSMTSPSYDPVNLNLVYRGAFQRPDCIADGNLANLTPNEYFNNQRLQRYSCRSGWNLPGRKPWWSGHGRHCCRIRQNI